MKTPDVSFWNNNSPLQDEYDRLHAKLVPHHGEADTVHGELLRCLSNVYYDVYNNGGCNLHIRRSEITYVNKFRKELVKYGLTPSQCKMAVDDLRSCARCSNWKSLDYRSDLCTISMEPLAEAVVRYVAAQDAK